MPDEWKDEGMKAQRQEYDQKIWQLLGDPMLYADLKNDPELADIEIPSFEPYDDDQDGMRTYVPDIKNAYLQAPVAEKIWCKLGSEFGSDAGKPAIIVRSLYGLKSAGASFCNHLADYNSVLV